MRATRRPLFLQVGRIVEGARGRWPASPALLDVGCAHGHLLDHFAEKGFSCSGVEPVERLRGQLEGRGVAVHARLEDVGPERAYDVITFIDTLYYFDKPGAALACALALLSRDGIIVVRNVNRTPFLRLMRQWRDRPAYRRVFGDQLVALSHRGVQEMVRHAGARLRASYFYEARLFHGIADRLLYCGLGVAATLTRLPVSPGILYVISRR
jgi:SAM-dependent methyltransferase